MVITLNIGTDRPEQTLQNAASDQGQHCLPLIQHYFRHIDR